MKLLRQHHPKTVVVEALNGCAAVAVRRQQSDAAAIVPRPATQDTGRLTSLIPVVTPLPHVSFQVAKAKLVRRVPAWPALNVLQGEKPDENTSSQRENSKGGNDGKRDPQPFLIRAE